VALCLKWWPLIPVSFACVSDLCQSLVVTSMVSVCSSIVFLPLLCLLFILPSSKVSCTLYKSTSTCSVWFICTSEAHTSGAFVTRTSKNTCNSVAVGICANFCLLWPIIRYWFQCECSPSLWPNHLCFYCVFYRDLVGTYSVYCFLCAQCSNFPTFKLFGVFLSPCELSSTVPLMLVCMYCVRRQAACRLSLWHRVVKTTLFTAQLTAPDRLLTPYEHHQPRSVIIVVWIFSVIWIKILLLIGPQ